MHTTHIFSGALRAKKRITVAILVCTGMVSTGIVASPLPASAAVADWQKSVSISSRWDTDFASDSFKQSVRNAKAMGATSIALIIPWFQTNDTTADVRNGANAPSDDTLGQAIDFIHGLGMQAVLKPHLQSGNNHWRAFIDSHDRDGWYKNYAAMLDHLGDVGKAHNAEMIVVGTELISMASPYMNPDNTERWKAMIADLRAHYSGKLTYSANWGQGNTWTNEFEEIKFWDDLDYIGISAYFNLSSSGHYSVSELENSWKTYEHNQIQPLQAKYKKPVLFTEIGYRSINEANYQPWNDTLTGGYNATMQVNLYEAMMDFWNTKSYMAGAILWDWNSDPNYGGEGNTDYTPNNKPAQATISKWWKSTGSQGDNGGTTGGDTGGNTTGTSTDGTTNPPPDTNPPPADVPAPTGSFGSSSNAPTHIDTGSQVSIPVTVTTTGVAKDVIVDVEIYDASNAKIFQKFFEHQNLSSTSSGSYAVDWKPSSAGSYRLKTGVFKSDWSTTYYWNDDMQDVTVSAPGQNPPPSGSTTTPAVTDVWWPIDGATVGGNQPFKVVLENKDVSEYTTTWRLEGNSEVPMGDSSQDWPHKESIVDVSGWNWKDEGPYKLTFTSRDLAGNVISQKSVQIYVR